MSSWDFGDLAPDPSFSAPVYFTEAEFRRATPSCHMSDMDATLLERLDSLRARLGFPLTITSAYRSPRYEIEKGRSGSSMHTKGIAVDIHCTDSNKRLLIVKHALELGFNGIGVASTFIHLDLREKPTMWTY